MQLTRFAVLAVISFIAVQCQANNSTVGDDMCCTNTKYGDWKNCGNAAGMWGVNSCNTCASFQCVDWSLGSNWMQYREWMFWKNTGISVYFGVGSYGNDQTRAGKCYRLAVEGGERELIVQAINQGGDVPDGNFDLQMGDGGFGIFDACTASGTSVPQWDGNDGQWGNRYGGWSSRSGCANLPKYPHCQSSDMDNLIELCEFSFDHRVRGGRITKMCEVRCPDELFTATNLRRADETNDWFECNGNVNGQLTSMMDCAKPSFSWGSNVKGRTYPGFEQVIPCRRDGYTRINS